MSVSNVLWDLRRFARARLTHENHFISTVESAEEFGLVLPHWQITSRLPKGEGERETRGERRGKRLKHVGRKQTFSLSAVFLL